MQYYYSILTSIITALFYCRITVFLMQTWYQVRNKIRQLMKTDFIQNHRSVNTKSVCRGAKSNGCEMGSKSIS